MADATSTAILSDQAWAELVAAKMGLSDEAETTRVRQVLTQAGVHGGRPPSNQHRAQVEAVYFSGIKVVRDDAEPVAYDMDPPSGTAAEDMDGNASASASAFQAAPQHETTTAPFSFQHTFDTTFTAFATEGKNLTGKSAILGVILWGLRGTPPTPTLQADVRDNWLRDAVLVVKVDSTRIVIAWRIDHGRPEGAIYTVLGDAPIDLSPLRAAGLASATTEWERAQLALTIDPSEGGETEPEPIVWPGAKLCQDLLDVGILSQLGVFVTADEFEEAVADTLMERLELEALPVWQRRPGSVDEHDADVAYHGWKTVAQAMAIVDPTSRSVLGEHPFATNLLLSLFLGSRWAIPTMVARTQKARTDQAVAAHRRRQEADAQVRKQSIDQLEVELAAARAALAALGDAPAYLEVLAATEAAKADSLAEARAHAAYQLAAITYGTAGRDLEAAEQDLHALAEAAATRRFWHSLRPSCCPRCDNVIAEEMWAREQAGQCSLCSNDFIETPETVEIDPEVVAGDPQGDNEDNEDEIVALRVQVANQKRIVEEASDLEETRRHEYHALRAAAARSAAALDQLDRAASADRYDVEMRIARLEARIGERNSIDADATLTHHDSDEFTSEVLKTALAYATAQRDLEQRQALAQVTEVITELGIEFGIRNLISARLGGNGHLPVVKGKTKENFGDLAPGERLRLRIALIVGLLRAGRASGTSRHPGLLIIDDLTTHEMNHGDAASMARRLADMPGLQVITASTYAITLKEAVGDRATIVGPPEGSDVMF